MENDEAKPAGPEAHLLSNGRYAVLLSATGAGFSAFEGLALTRWAPDPTRDADGFFVYLRDIETGRLRSATARPVIGRPEAYRFQCSGGRARFAPATPDAELELCLEVCVAPDVAAELRRLTLVNRGARTRRLEVTTYAELVLNALEADAAHPAFSKLFVQTAYWPGPAALAAWRRPRSANDVPLWVAHRLVGADAGVAFAFETDRMRFLGRGRSPAAPRALEPGATLSGTAGNVLDPVFALRAPVTLEPGETRSCTAVLAAGRDRGDVEALLRRFAADAAIDAAFGAARPAPPGAEATLGLPERWRRGIRIVSGSVRDAGAPGAAARGDAPPAGAPAVPAAGAAEPRDGATGLAAGTVTGAAPARPAERPASPTLPPAGEPLLLQNGWGGFTEDGTEYVIRLENGPDGVRRPPLPWVNVIANESVGCLVSESGAVSTWALNSRLNRLTPWSNDPVTDPHGEALYVRDEDAGVFWSPTPGPVPGTGAYEARHGFGYTTFRHDSRELEQEVTVFVPPDDPVRIVRVRIRNAASRARRLSLFAYARLVLGHAPPDVLGDIVTEYDPRTGAILARNPNRGEFSARVAFAAAVGAAGAVSWSHTADRTAFLGPGGDTDAPAAVRAAGPLDGRTGAALDPCAAFRCALELAPGASVECAFLLGEAEDEAAARACLARYPDIAAVERALGDTRASWRRILGAVQVETPARMLDPLLNGWLAYQNLSCRMWGRTAYYQSGGAFGFRDQLQDAAALLYYDPAITRRQILLHAAHQFVEGDVMHWWHPPLSKGMRTRFSDDLLWLPYVTAFYVRATGDAGVLDEEVRYLTARALEPGEDEAYLVPSDSGTVGTVYEHCCRALDRSLTRGPHGLPLMGTGDWNDGMNRVGREGRGESVWLGFFLHDILGAFLPLCEARGDVERAERYAAYRDRLAGALNDAGWDGAWYRRAYYDDGTPLGAATGDECRIDAIAQAWAVLSGAAPPERADRALDALEAHLISEKDRIIRLLTPAFDRTPHDPGYIKGYVPGVRENGGQYTHGALWAVRAFAEAGRAERAATLLEMLSPLSHARSPEDVAVYRTEPYVIAADVYGEPPHVGRGGWTWYTGSAGWMLRIALESVLGFELRDGREIRLRPCIPADWPGFRIRWRHGADTVHEITVVRAAPGADRTRATADGVEASVVDGAVVIPLADDGAVHRVHVTLAPDVGPRYAPRIASPAGAT